MYTQTMRKQILPKLLMRYFFIIIVGIIAAICCEANEKETTLFENRYKSILYLLKNNKKVECSTGSFWIQMNSKAKFSYLNGFLDGIVSNQYRCKGIIQKKRAFKDVDYQTFFSNKNLRILVNSIDQKYANDKDYYMPVHDRLTMIGAIEDMMKDMEQWSKIPGLMDRINNDPELDAEYEKIRKDMESNKKEHEKRYKDIRF